MTALPTRYKQKTRCSQLACISFIIIVITERGQKSTVYHSDKYCWLSETYIYYAFLIPVACVLVYNTYIFIRGLLITYRVISRVTVSNAISQFYFHCRLQVKRFGTTGERSKDGCVASLSCISYWE